MVTAISPIDGRYASNVAELTEVFSKYALLRNRVKVKVEVLWLLALCAEPGIAECLAVTTEEEEEKQIEAVTNYDVKEKSAGTSLVGITEFLPFACTSEAINSLFWGRSSGSGPS